MLQMPTAALVISRWGLMCWRTCWTPCVSRDACASVVARSAYMGPVSQAIVCLSAIRHGILPQSRSQAFIHECCSIFWQWSWRCSVQSVTPSGTSTICRLLIRFVQAAFKHRPVVYGFEACFLAHSDPFRTLRSLTRNGVLQQCILA